MPLAACKLCGKVFASGGKFICDDCFRHLEEVYGKAHEYLRDHNEDRFDVKKLSDAMEVNPVDIQTLVEMGWLERDIQTYSRTLSMRQRQAREIGRELEKLREKNKMTSYGGEVYSRKRRIK